MLRRIFPLLAALSALFLIASAAGADPRVAGETALDRVPGEIVAWRDSVYCAVGRDSAGAVRFYRVRRSNGTVTKSFPLGVNGRGAFLCLSPDDKYVMARETDSLGVHHLQMGLVQSGAWKKLFPVTDLDPHVSWFADGIQLLYQDILNDSLGTPSVFKVFMDTMMPPKLFIYGVQRPLVSPTGDAVVAVGVDTLNPGSTRDLEQRQGVALQDIQEKEFRWIAPMRTWVPTRGAWSPDGAYVALVGYGVDSTGTLERRLYIHSRITQQTRTVHLAGDAGHPERDHASDTAVWSPDGRWVAVGRLAGRGSDPEGKGGIWLVSPAGVKVVTLKPTRGSWRGSPIWTGNQQIAIADAAPGPEEPGPHKWWLIDIEEQ